MSSEKKRNSEITEFVLNRLPDSEYYENSYMHKEELTSMALSIHTNIIVTGSSDGFLKFWKKNYRGIEFSKQYRAHIGSVSCISISPNGVKIVSIGSSDVTIKIYDGLSFDMIDKITLKENPIYAELGQSIYNAEPYLIISTFSSLGVCALTGSSEFKYLEIHATRTMVVKYNQKYNACISIDDQGMMEYWGLSDFAMPEGLRFEYKSKTDLYDLAKSKELVLSLVISPNCELFCVYSNSRKFKIFEFSTGKLVATISENYEDYQQVQNSPNSPYRLERIEFHRRMALEKEIDKCREKVIPSFDETSQILIYGCYLGIKFVVIDTCEVIKIIGKSENPRFVQVHVFQGFPMLNTSGNAGSGGSSSQGLKESDPSLFVTGFKRNRFFIFSKRNPVEENKLENRDVVNESINESETLAMVPKKASIRLATSAVIHTTMGDITVKFFPKYCPKTVENFTGLCMNGYYCQHIFHRVIKGFMIQTGDPEGNGHGGTSIWGKEFEDEICEDLKHDRPFTLSMANRGPNTNGSQFFITTVAASWLNGRHTLFGRVVNGMDVVCRIESVPCDRKNKPKAEVRIIDVTINLD